MNTKRLWILSILLVCVFACAANAQTQSTVTVVGTGTVLAKPDTVHMSVSMSHTARTTRMAQDEVNRMVQQVLAVLKNAKIEDKNISTTSLTFRSEYEYSSNRRVLIGQRAEQGITFSIDDIGKDGARVAGIIDQLININGIELNQVNFSIKSNSELFIQSRQLAFQKAAEKAQQYAALSKLRVGKVLSISEEGTQQVMPIQARNMAMEDTAKSKGDSGASIPTGELEITTRIIAVFLME
ncbi:MAG: SIMPL domain-containing protein [Spirochaetota bacterium]|nr:SIMPL domain-containing protein [Spirochaetota bacterium]